MQHPYNILINHEGNYEFLFEQYLFVKIFKPIWDLYEDKSIPTGIIRFIVFGFSIESPHITVSGDRRNELAAIFKHIEIEDNYYRDVVLFEEETIKLCTQKWLEFQDNAQLEYLLTLKSSYIQQQSGSLSLLKKADGVNIDYDQKHKCIEHMRELKIWIKEAEQELIQNNPKMKESYKIVGLDNTKRNSRGKGMEAYLKQEGNGVS